MACLEDLKKLRQISIIRKNLDGVIVGRAIYENKIKVNEAIEILK